MSFWKIFFGSLLAFVIGSFLVLFIFIAFIFGIAAAFSSEETVSVKPSSVLSLDLSYEIPEQTTYEPFQGFNFRDFHPYIAPGVYDIIKSIEKAKDDDNIKGIYLQSGFIGGGLATTNQIRDALLDFKKSGKFIVAYSEIYTEKGYYLASIADKVIVNPKGIIAFNGMSAQYPFFKELLNKVGVQVQVFYDGKFKTATEPFRLDSMSKENEFMTITMLDDLHNRMLTNIASSRNMSFQKLDSINDNLLVQTAFDTRTYGLSDKVWFEDQVRDYIKEELKLKEKDKIEFVTLAKYMKVPGKKETISFDADRIAVLFAQGDIVDGEGKDNQIGSSDYMEQLRKLREDDKVKAIVFRVNSPGGSALASDVIAREVEITAAKKPVVISMGDYAASGGYYISALATKIVAEPNTLTGSIGVFGLLPNMQKLFRDKIGINFDGVGTGKYSDFGNPMRPLREDEKRIIQKGVDTIYRDFKATVVKGRKLNEATVDSIAQGRVWTGSQALGFGLVDTLGGLEDAIRVAAHLANSSKYRIVEYPEVNKNLFQIVEMFQENRETQALKSKLGLFYSTYKDLEEISNMNTVQARMPFLVEEE